MGLQIPRGHCTKVPQESFVRSRPSPDWQDHPRTGKTERSGSFGRQCLLRSHAHGSQDPTQAFGRFHHGLPQRQERHPSPQYVLQETRCHPEELLVQRLLREHRRHR